MESEIWLPVVGYEGLYEVSDLGRVRSLDSLKPSGPTGAGAYILPGRVLAQSTDKHGYKRVGLSSAFLGSSRRPRKGFFVHRLVLMAHMRLPLPEETDVNHRDFNTSNNLIGNLEWATRKSNMEYSSVRGRLYGAVARGGRTKLTSEQVAGILLAGASGHTPQHAIAKKFGIRQQTVSKILNGHRWTFGDARGVPVIDTGVRARTPLNTRLSVMEVRDIKALGYTKSLSAIATMFGVSRNCVQNVRDGTTWKDITSPFELGQAP